MDFRPPRRYLDASAEPDVRPRGRPPTARAAAPLAGASEPWPALLALLFVVATLASVRAQPAATDARGEDSLQREVDQHPGTLVFVPAGDHVVHHAIRITTAGAGLWGPGRIIQANPDEAIVEIVGAPGAELRDVTLTRAEGAMETHRPGVLVSKADGAVLANVRLIDNWSDGNGIRIQDCARIVVRDCLIKNYSRVSIDDRTKTPFLGYAFNCTEGTGLNLVNVRGALVENNRILELRLLPTPELKAKYQLGRIVKKNATRGALIAKKSWDSNYVNIWRQGAALHVGNGETSDYIQILGNYIENTQQGLDLHADHIVVANNIVNNAPHGLKAMHGARNLLVIGNQFTKNDLFGIGLMQGTASHVAGQLPNGRGAAPVGPNIDGYSIIAHNIISDFGTGLSHWLWPVNASIGPAPIELGAPALPNTPVLRDVIIDGNIVYDPGKDQVLENGIPRVEAPRYRYAVRIEPGKNAPEGLRFSDNLFDPGIDGVSTHTLNTGTP